MVISIISVSLTLFQTLMHNLDKRMLPIKMRSKKY